MTLSSRMAVEYFHPYVDELVGPGRWFIAYADSGEEIGYVWTNDRFGLGLLSTVTSYTSQSALDWFLYSRNVWGRTETTATDAFESYFQMQSTWSPAGLTISAGDLRLDLMKKVREDMATAGGYVEYGITTREDGEVLELIRHDPTGSYLRDGGKWVKIDPDAPEEAYPTVYNQEWHEVAEDILDFYDQNASGEGISLRDVQMYIA